MNTSQLQAAATLAAQMIADGADPQGFVHIQFYDADDDYYDDRIQGLSSPLPADADLSGHTSRYYRLGYLAQFANSYHTTLMDALDRISGPLEMAQWASIVELAEILRDTGKPVCALTLEDIHRALYTLRANSEARKCTCQTKN